jgi:hypothetical protein
MFELSDLGQVGAHRAEIENIRNSNPNKSIHHIDAVLASDLWKLQFDRNILKVCTDIFGTFGFINDFNLQCERIDVGDKFKGWHPDCGSEGDAYYLSDIDYKFAKIGIYFQKNTEGLGGGIDVVPYTHHLYRLPRLIRNALYRVIVLFDKRFGRTISTSPGSVVVFDSRLLHRSTELLNCQTPREEKFVLYWEVSGEHFAEDFLINAVKRGYCKTHSSGDPSFFRSYLPFSFPEDYHFEYIKAAENSKVTIYSLNKYICDALKKIGSGGSLWSWSR